MDDEMKVKITNGFDFAGSFMLGTMIFIIFGSLGALGIEWLASRFSDHKERYTISFENQSYTTADYERKWNGQVIFYDCEDGDRVIVNPSVGVVKVARVDPQVAKECKAQ